jgi:hypothetical protein
MWPFTTKKPKDPRNNHEFTLDDSKAGIEVRESKASLQKLKYQIEENKLRYQAEIDEMRAQRDLIRVQQQLEDLQGDMEEVETDSGSVEDQMMTMLLGKFLGGQQPINTHVTHMDPPGDPIAPQEATTDGQPTDQDLRELWNKLPQNVKNQALTQMGK